jgi:hypothetical protein
MLRKSQYPACPALRQSEEAMGQSVQKKALPFSSIASSVGLTTAVASTPASE